MTRANPEMIKLANDAVARHVGGKLGTIKCLADLDEGERGCVTDLLRGVGPDGGHARRATFEKIVSTAFLSGVLHAANTLAKSDL